MDNDNVEKQEGTEDSATEVVEKVESAATGAEAIAEQGGEDGWNVVAEELRGLRSDIKKLMKNTAPVSTTVPEVHVEEPPSPERKVRRGHRKVTRRGTE